MFYIYNCWLENFLLLENNSEMIKNKLKILFI